MKTYIEFKSELFKPYLSEGAQVNEGVYGAELAWWLSQELAKKGIETGYPDYEDWGWLITYVSGDDDEEYRLCIRNVFLKDNHWRIWLKKTGFSFWWKNTNKDGLKPLMNALVELMTETPGIEILRMDSKQ